MRLGSFPTRYSANCSTAVRTISELPSREASPHPTMPSSVSMRTKSHRGTTLNVSIRLMTTDASSAQFLGDGLDRPVRDLLGGPPDVDNDPSLVGSQGFEDVVLRLQQLWRHVLVFPCADAVGDHLDRPFRVDDEEVGHPLPQQVAVLTLQRRADDDDAALPPV